MSGVDAGPLARAWSEFRDHIAAKHPGVEIDALRGVFLVGASAVVKTMLHDRKGLALIRMRMEITDYSEAGNDTNEKRPAAAEPDAAHQAVAAHG